MIGSPGNRATFNTTNYNEAIRLFGSPSFQRRLRGNAPRNRYNSNSNSNNINPNNLRRMRTARMTFGVNGGTAARRLNFGNNNTNRPNASNYIKNEKRMKKDESENKKTNKIKWEKMDVKELPSDPITYENFKTGEKAVKIDKLYLNPDSFRKLARMSMTKALNANGNMVLFINPFTRGKVRKNDLKFVIIKRVTKR